MFIVHFLITYGQVTYPRLVEPQLPFQRGGRPTKFGFSRSGGANLKKTLFENES